MSADSEKITEYYTPLRWKKEDPFYFPGMVEIPVEGDGHCLFHAFCRAMSSDYLKGECTDASGSKTIKLSRQDFVKGLRKELAAMLAMKINPDDKKSPTYYDMLARGKLAEFAKGDDNPHISKYTLTGMQKELLSGKAVGAIYIEYISKVIGRNIYILDKNEHDVYIIGNDIELLFNDDNTNVVILYTGNHFNVVGVKDKDGEIITHFSELNNKNNVFIKAIRKRMEEKIANGQYDPHSKLPPIQPNRKKVTDLEHSNHSNNYSHPGNHPDSSDRYNRMQNGFRGPQDPYDYRHERGYPREDREDFHGYHPNNYERRVDYEERKGYNGRYPEERGRRYNPADVYQKSSNVYESRGQSERYHLENRDKTRIEERNRLPRRPDIVSSKKSPDGRNRRSPPRRVPIGPERNPMRHERGNIDRLERERRDIRENRRLPNRQDNSRTRDARNIRDPRYSRDPRYPNDQRAYDHRASPGRQRGLPDGRNRYPRIERNEGPPLRPKRISPEISINPLQREKSSERSIAVDRENKEKRGNDNKDVHGESSPNFDSTKDVINKNADEYPHEHSSESTVKNSNEFSGTHSGKGSDDRNVSKNDKQFDEHGPPNPYSEERKRYEHSRPTYDRYERDYYRQDYPRREYYNEPERYPTRDPVRDSRYARGPHNSRDMYDEDYNRPRRRDYNQREPRAFDSYNRGRYGNFRNR